MEERTRTEQNGVGLSKVRAGSSITDELRKEARGFGRHVYTAPQADCLTAIADRIDERYHRDMATAQQVGYNEGEDAAMRDGWGYLRHVQPDSWIRIIGDAMSFDGDGWYSTRDDAMAELVERCRKLAGEAE